MLKIGPGFFPSAALRFRECEANPSSESILEILRGGIGIAFLLFLAFWDACF